MTQCVGKMSTEFQSASGFADSQKRFWAALVLGVGGAVVDILTDDFLLYAAPQLCAVVVGSQLPKRRFRWLVGLLAIAIVLPALVHPSDAALAQRLIGLALLAVVVVVVRRELTSDMDDKTGNAPQLLFTPTNPHDDPLTVIRSDRNADDRLAQTSSDLTSDYCQLIDRLESSRSFNQGQIWLIENELRSLAESSDALNRVSSLGTGDFVGRYTIDEQLGRGGEAYVFRGHDSVGGEAAAIKIVHNARISERFRREMRMVRKLAHPNIVTAYEVADFHGLPFIAMELLRGPDLNACVRENGPRGWLNSSRYILQTARALAHAHHRKLIHRDVKPGNIMLNGNDQVKLVDLGLAVMAMGPSTDEPQDPNIAGTLPYMAPEQARSLAAATAASDIFSLGATWFYLLTGKPRLRGNSYRRQFENLLLKRSFNVLPDNCLPGKLEAIYQRMVEYDPDDRYGSCDEVAADIEHELAIVGEAVEPDVINILVVEDSRTDMHRTIEVLRRTNQSLQIHQARTLAEGINAYNSVPVDLILLDLMLPDSEGVDTVKAIHDVAPNIPIVVLTGASDAEIDEECFQAGAIAFVSKLELTAHRMERMIFVTLSRYDTVHRV